MAKVLGEFLCLLEEQEEAACAGAFSKLIKLQVSDIADVSSCSCLNFPVKFLSGFSLALVITCDGD
jgi:hypothetical protein